MTAPLKVRLIASIEMARDREVELIAEAGEPRGADPLVWTAKDNLAHLTAWRFRAAEMLTAARTGTPPSPGFDDETVTNRGIFEINKDRPVSEIVERAKQSYAELIAAIDACSNEDLLRPHPLRPERVVWELIPGNGHGHLAEHLAYWHLDRKREADAVGAHRWAQDVVTQCFPEPRDRSFAAYNIACFYSRRGLADEALPNFETAFELNPELKAWAQKDSDLDPIRGNATLQELLA